MTSSDNEQHQPKHQEVDLQQELEALSDAIGLAPLGVLSSGTVERLRKLRGRLSTPSDSSI